MNYKREYKKYLISSVLDTANNKIASNSFITAFAVYLGLSNFAIGIYSVLDTITNIIQVFAAPLFSRIGQSKLVVLTNYTIYRVSSICFAFIPFITNNIEIRTILFFIFASIYAITGELGYITFVNWRMTLIQKQDRTNFAATRNIYKNTLVMGFSLIMGIILNKFTANGYELYGFIILFTIVSIIAIVDISIRINTYKPVIEDKKITVKETIVKPASDKSFRKVLVIGGLNRFAYGIGIMYLNVFLLRYLKICLKCLLHLLEVYFCHICLLKLIPLLFSLFLLFFLFVLTCILDLLKVIAHILFFLYVNLINVIFSFYFLSDFFN